MRQMKISDKSARVDRYMPSDGDEALLAEINERLAEDPKSGLRPPHPTILISGTPRAGTTLIAQSVSQYFEVDYVDNLAAKFWLAPVTGLRLSRMVFGDRKGSEFASEFGRTKGSDIHSFHYFWMHHLKLENVEDLFSSPASRGVRWDEINGHIAAMQGVSDLPFAFRGYYPSLFMADFAREVPGSVFVLIRRDPLAQALSIYQARLAYHGDPTRWWSMQPPEINALLHLPPERQIAGQVFGLRRFFDKQIQDASGRLPVIVVDYEDLCDDAVPVLERIGAEIERHAGLRVPTTGVLPDTGGKHAETYHEKLVERMKQAIEEFAAEEARQT